MSASRKTFSASTATAAFTAASCCTTSEPPESKFSSPSGTELSVTTRRFSQRRAMSCDMYEPDSASARYAAIAVSNRRFVMSMPSVSKPRMTLRASFMTTAPELAMNRCVLSWLSSETSPMRHSISPSLLHSPSEATRWLIGLRPASPVHATDMPTERPSRSIARRSSGADSTRKSRQRKSVEETCVVVEVSVESGGVLLVSPSLVPNFSSSGRHRFNIDENSSRSNNFASAERSGDGT